MAEAASEAGLMKVATTTSRNSLRLKHFSTTSRATILILDSCGGLSRCRGVLKVRIAVATVDLLIVAHKHLQLVSLWTVALLAGETTFVEVPTFLHHLLLLEHSPATPGTTFAIHRKDSGGVCPQEGLLSFPKVFCETFSTVDLAVRSLEGINKGRVQFLLAFVACKALLVEKAGLG